MDMVAYVELFMFVMVKRNRESNTSAEIEQGVTAGAAAAAVMIADQVPAGEPNHAASAKVEASPPRAAAVSAVMPASPATNRERFRAASMPAQVSCDLYRSVQRSTRSWNAFQLPSDCTDRVSSSNQSSTAPCNVGGRLRRCRCHHLERQRECFLQRQHRTHGAFHEDVTGMQ